MTKEDIVNEVWEQTRLNKKQAVEAVDALLSILKESILEKKKVKIGGFGVFEPHKRKPRMGRNPRTGELAKIKAATTFKFRPSKTLKKKVSQQ